ncbi:hypothetical protein WBG78_16330 [Chryseolinea sp. T2]|uniref:hypothetical protein n=1 Tax=Chryseolinea sp. T2 TaxID=3129255 RepID=UPI00307715E8
MSLNDVAVILSPMNFMTFWILVISGFLILIGGLLFLSYWIPKKLGNRRLGVWLSRLLAAALVVWAGSVALKDYLFFKTDAKEFLARQNIILNDEFEILNNDDDEILGAFQRFQLEISDNDREKLIASIVTSANFGADSINPLENNQITIKNYQEGDLYIRKKRTSYGQNQVPLLEIVEVDKNSNVVTCYTYNP